MDGGRQGPKQADWLARVASGQALVVLAQQERKACYQLDIFKEKSALAHAGYALTAIKSIVPSGVQANDAVSGQAHCPSRMQKTAEGFF